MGATDQSFVENYLSESVEALQRFAIDETGKAAIGAIADAMIGCLRQGNKIMVAGNGGSAGDSQHIAGEFISRLLFDHAPLAAIALTTDTSVLTAIGNDYGYDKIFERQVLGLGNRGDVLLGISTSGKSSNVLRAFEAARNKGVVTVGFTGQDDTAMDALCDYIFHAPSRKTSVVQQIHIVAAHMICGLVEKRMFPATA